MNILKDIKSGALPLSELPKFLIWLLGRIFWPLLAFIFAVLYAILVTR